MANNKELYGFRWNTAANGGRPMPSPVPLRVASGQTFDVNSGASNISIGAGDPLSQEAGGGVILCDGVEGSGGILAPGYICTGVRSYWDATKGVMTPASLYPDAVVWGTILERAGVVYGVPVDAGIWEIDADTAATVATEAGCLAEVGSNCNHILSGASGETRAKPELDISQAANTSTFQWNIVGVAQTPMNSDYTGTNVKYLVRANVVQWKTVGLVAV